MDQDNNTIITMETCNIYDVVKIFPMFQYIISNLKVREMLNLVESSFLKQLKLQNGDSNVYDEYIEKMIHGPRQLLKLYWKYKGEYRYGSPIIYACQIGHMEDVQLFVNLHPYHKYITNRDVIYGCDGKMTLKEYVNQIGTDGLWTPLLKAVYKEHFNIAQYLIERCEADPTTPNIFGFNALHMAVVWNKKNTAMIKLLLNHMPTWSINKKHQGGATPLDFAYGLNSNIPGAQTSPIQQEIIALIRSNGGKANCFDANGELVGGGKGELQDDGSNSNNLVATLAILTYLDSI